MRGHGGTPDDLPRQSASEAVNNPLQHHPQGMEILRQFCDKSGRELTAERCRMVEFPQGASLIPNPVNGIPGFKLANHHFVPGFPQMAWPMIEWVLDHLYPALSNKQYREEAVLVNNLYESAIIPLMESLLQDYPDTRIFSLPILDFDEPRIELGAKGPAQVVKARWSVKNFTKKGQPGEGD